MWGNKADKWLRVKFRMPDGSPNTWANTLQCSNGPHQGKVCLHAYKVQALTFKLAYGGVIHATSFTIAIGWTSNTHGSQLSSISKKKKKNTKHKTQNKNKHNSVTYCSHYGLILCIVLTQDRVCLSSSAMPDVSFSFFISIMSMTQDLAM